MNSYFDYDTDGPDTIIARMQALTNRQKAFEETKIAEAAYKMQFEGCAFETRDLLQKMLEDSEKESRLNQKRFIISTLIGLATLFVSLAMAAPSLTP